MRSTSRVGNIRLPSDCLCTILQKIRQMNMGFATSRCLCGILKKICKLDREFVTTDWFWELLEKETKQCSKLHIPSQELECQIYFALQFRTPVPTKEKTRPAPNRYTTPVPHSSSARRKLPHFSSNKHKGIWHFSSTLRTKVALQFQLEKK